MFTQFKGKEVILFWLFAIAFLLYAVVVTIHYIIGSIYDGFKRMIDHEKIPPKLVEEQKPPEPEKPTRHLKAVRPVREHQAVYHGKDVE